MRGGALGALAETTWVPPPIRLLETDIIQIFKRQITCNKDYDKDVWAKKNIAPPYCDTDTDTDTDTDIDKGQYHGDTVECYYVIVLLE